MIKLYGIDLSNNVSKVRHCLHYLGLDYENIPTSPLLGETQTEEFQAINPIGKVPVIEIDGVKIFESNAINKYLASKNNSPIYPENLEKRAVVDQWMDFSSIHVGAAIGRVLFNRVFAPLVGEKVDEESIQVGLKFLDKYLPILDKQLGENKYLASDDFTLADINLLAFIDSFELTQESLESYKNVTKWQSRLHSEDWYRKGFNGGTYCEFVQKAIQQKMAQAK